MTDFDPRHYGKKRVSDILKGACSKLVLENGHHHNPCYGTLKDLSRREIFHFIEELIGLGILIVEDEVFPTLEISRKGKQLLGLKRKIKVDFPMDLCPTPIPPFDIDMYGHLNNVRLVQAKDEGIPPYCVVPNSTLMQMCTRTVEQVEDLEDIKGFGPARTHKYGELFVQAITGYQSEKKGRDSKMNNGFYLV